MFRIRFLLRDGTKAWLAFTIGDDDEGWLHSTSVAKEGFQYESPDLAWADLATYIEELAEGMISTDPSQGGGFSDVRHIVLEEV